MYTGRYRYIGKIPVWNNLPLEKVVQCVEGNLTIKVNYIQYYDYSIAVSSRYIRKGRTKNRNMGGGGSSIRSQASKIVWSNREGWRAMEIVRLHQSMMGSGMVFSDLFPRNKKLALANPIAYPVIMHIHSFGAF
jgi:hypothetical protein